MKVKYKPTLEYHAKYWRKMYNKQIEFDEYVKLLYTKMEDKNGRTTRKD